MILVEDHGSLVGLLTVKDCLRYTVKQQHAQQAGGVWLDEESVHGLEAILDRVWIWASDIFDRTRLWMSRVIRR